MRTKFIGNEIHPTAIIGPDVRMGNGNYIGPYCVIQGKTDIGDNNRFEAHVSIGAPPEHRNHYWNEKGGVSIGSNCVFREFTTVNCGVEMKTTLCDGVVMLRGSHVGHDSYIENDVTLSCDVMIGGHSTVHEGANFGLGSMCHQHSVIGAYAFIGMNSCVIKGEMVMPGNIYVGNPAKFLKANTVGLERAGITAEELARFMMDWVQGNGEHTDDRG